MPRWGHFSKPSRASFLRHACCAACRNAVNPSRDDFVVPLTPVMATETLKEPSSAEQVRSGHAGRTLPTRGQCAPPPLSPNFRFATSPEKSHAGKKVAKFAP